MTEQRYNLRPNVKIRLGHEGCISCVESDRHDEIELLETNPSIPGKVGIRPSGDERVTSMGDSDDLSHINVGEEAGVFAPSEGSSGLSESISEPAQFLKEPVASLEVKTGRGVSNLETKVSQPIETSVIGGGPTSDNITPDQSYQPVTTKRSLQFQGPRNVNDTRPGITSFVHTSSNTSQSVYSQEPRYPSDIRHKDTTNILTSTDYQTGGSYDRNCNRESAQTVHATPWGDTRPIMSPIARPINQERRLNRECDYNSPRVKLPTYDGKGEWEPFWVQFEFFCNQYKWNEDDKLSQLMSCLRDTAIQFVARQPMSIRGSFSQLVESLTLRFGDHVLPETHRVALQSIKRGPRESLQEYVSRVSDAVNKGYPGLEGSELHTKLTIEAIVNGLNDPPLVYEILSKKPRSVREVLDMVTWHKCCKSASKRWNDIRQVTENDSDVRQVNGGGNTVTEERLVVFGKELQNRIISSMKDMMKIQNGPRNRDSNRETKRCYNCKQLGHFAGQCDKHTDGGRPHRGNGPSTSKVNDVASLN